MDYGELAIINRRSPKTLACISCDFKRNINFVYAKLGSWQYKPTYAQW